LENTIGKLGLLAAHHFNTTWTMDAGALEVSGETSKVLGRTVSSLESPTTMEPSTMSRSLWQHTARSCIWRPMGRADGFYYVKPARGLLTVGVKRERCYSKVKKRRSNIPAPLTFSRNMRTGSICGQRSSHSNESRSPSHYRQVPRSNADANKSPCGYVLVFTYKASTPN